MGKDGHATPPQLLHVAKKCPCSCTIHTNTATCTHQSTKGSTKGTCGKAAPTALATVA